MKDVIPELDFCVVDLETTGFSPKSGAGIIEIGSVLIRDGRIHKTFQKMVDPGHDIPPKITSLTGITNEDIRGADPVDAVLPQFLNFRDSAVLVAHNAPFDLSFLKYFANESLDDTHVDTLQLARRLFDFNSNALTELIREFGLERNDAHRALDDALATAELFLILAEEVTEPEDYVRCNLPGPVREKSPYDLTSSLTSTEVIRDEDTAKEFIHDLLKQTDRQVGLTKWAKILAGSRGQDIEKYRDNEGYGRLRDWTQQKIKDLLSEMIDEGGIRKLGEHYPVLEPIVNPSEDSDPLPREETGNPF